MKIINSAAQHLKREKRVTLKVKALTQIRNAIIFGKFPPGTRLIEQELSQAMGISRLPIREALSNLEQAGLVTVIPYKGALVSSFSRKDIVDLFMTRELLEVHALKLLMQEKDKIRQALLRLRSIVSIMKANSGRDSMTLNMVDYEFHGTICECTDNTALYDTWKFLSAKTQTLFVLTERYTTGEDLVHQHVILYESIDSGSFEIAAGGLRDHLQLGKSYVLQKLHMQYDPP
ncbi:MAG: GntR family transcriptional regulator [Deltaproteobacteria bacterium]|jgi:DNA-binding GntR family transcriptional regulator|nr:GntR family transcriptional regulator [Deltaproteobacteria bacterium]